MLDHVTIGVTDFDRAREFYDRALQPLGTARLYGTFVLDPDGHNVEAVCHLPQKP